MKVKELIEKLKNYKEDENVLFHFAEKNTDVYERLSLEEIKFVDSKYIDTVGVHIDLIKE